MGNQFASRPKISFGTGAMSPPKDTPTNYLNELIEFKHDVIKDILQSQEVVSLLLDKPNIDMESDEAYNIVGNNVFDYDYVDKTVQRGDAYIMVDTEMIQPVSGTINHWYLYVQIVCAKSYMTIDGKRFRGLRGNRRDNLVLAVDSLLNSRYDIGIGPLELQSVSPANVPDTFTSTLLTYSINHFRRERIKKEK